MLLKPPYLTDTVTSRFPQVDFPRSTSVASPWFTRARLGDALFRWQSKHRSPISPMAPGTPKCLGPGNSSMAWQLGGARTLWLRLSPGCHWLGDGQSGDGLIISSFGGFFYQNQQQLVPSGNEISAINLHG
jgi:hypothetical protein